MVTRLKEVDAVMVGMGWTGAIVARELAKAGLQVVGLERGQDRTPGEDFTLPGVRDEMKYSQRLELMSDNSVDTITFRNEPAEMALPIRRWGAFLPGEGVGGSGIHWGGLHWRNLPADFRIRSELTQRYGAKAIPDDMTITDWPLSYRRARAVLRPLRQAVRRLRPGRQPARPDCRRRQSLRRAAQRPLPQQAGQILPCRHAVRAGREEPRLSPVPGAGRDRERRLSSTTRASRSAPANIAASATAWPARPTPRRRPTRRCCRCCARIRSSSCARAPM